MMIAAHHPSGIPIDTYVFQSEIEARMDGIAQLVLPPEIVEGKYNAEAHHVVFTVADGETRVMESQVILIPAVQPPPGKGGPFGG